MLRYLLFLVVLIISSQVALAADSANPASIRLENAAVTRWRMGVEITAEGGPCAGLVATLPMPLDWPEQQVKVLEEKASRQAKITYRTLEGGAKQIVVTIPKLAGGETASAVVQVEVTKSQIAAPSDTAGLMPPKGTSREMAKYLTPSPFIESTDPKIRQLAPEIIKGKTGGWEQVEAIYNYVRENVKYVEGDIKGAVAALNDKTGDCEELTSLFVAFCRANKIPARMVWLPGHCYPEFYLEDKGGQGHWYPCQAAGDPQFGGMMEARPILQKGDNFKTPEQPKPQRYVAETLKGSAIRGAGNPKSNFFRERVMTDADATPPSEPLKLAP